MEEQTLYTVSVAMRRERYSPLWTPPEASRMPPKEACLGHLPHIQATFKSQAHRHCVR